MRLLSLMNSEGRKTDDSLDSAGIHGFENDDNLHGAGIQGRANDDNFMCTALGMRESNENNDLLLSHSGFVDASS